MAPPTQTSGAAECGQSRSIPMRTAIDAPATASVGSEVSGRCENMLRRSAKKECLVMWTPSNFGA